MHNINHVVIHIDQIASFQLKSPQPTFRNNSDDSNQECLRL